MTAQIIPFPSRNVDAERLTRAGEVMRRAVLVPTSADPELDMLLQIGGKLLDNLDDFEAADCWIVRLEEWEAKNGRQVMLAPA